MREGLGARLKALIDCGWGWGELGKEGLRSLGALQSDSSAGDGGQNPKDTDSFFVKASSESGISSISPSQSASQINHDHHDARPPVFHSFRSSELLSAPPLAAEFSTNTIRPISMATTTTNGTLSGSGTSTPAHAALLAATASTLTYAPAVAVHIPPSSTPSALGVANGVHVMEYETENMGRSEIHLPLPPPHALGGEYVNIPLAEMIASEVEGNRSSPPSSDRLAGRREDEHKRVMAHYPQHENLHELTPQTVELQLEEPVQEQETPVTSEKGGNTVEGHERKATQDPESSSDEAQVFQKLEVVENPKFISEKQMEEEENNERLAKGGEGYRVPFGSPHLPQTQSGPRTAANDKNPKISTSSPSKTFLGSLRGLFGSKDKPPSTSHSKTKLRAPAADSSDSDSSSTNEDWRSPTKKRKKVLKTLLFRPPDKKTVSSGAKWELGRGGLDSWNGNPSGSGSGLTGTTRRKVRKSQADESSRITNGASEGWGGAVDAIKRGPTGTSMGRVKAGSVDKLELGGTGKQENHRGRTRASSDVGTSIAGGSLNQRLNSTRRLKKNRAAADGSVVERNGSSGSGLDMGGSGGKPTKTAFGGPPVAVSAAIAKATWVKDNRPGAGASLFDPNKEMPHVEKQGISRRRDIGVASRKKEGREYYGPDNDGEETSSPTPSSSKGQIIDLGERRAKENERERERGGFTQKWEEDDKSAALRPVVKETEKAVARSSSLSSPRKATTVLTVHSNEEGSTVPSDRIPRNSSFGSKGGSDLGKTRRTDSLGQSSFSASSSRLASPLAYSPPPSVSTPKSTLETVPGPTSKTTTSTPATMSLMSIVEDVKRIREAGQMTTSASAKSGTKDVVRTPPRTTRENLESFGGHRGASRAGEEQGEDKAAGSGLFQVQAPGSVFDYKHQTSAGPKSDSSSASPSVSALGVGVQQRQGPGQVTKTPLKSALKNTSRTPSPSPLVVSASLPLVASAPLNGLSHLRQPLLSITGKSLVEAENESTYESGEEEFFTDEGELDGENHVNPATAVYTVLPTANSQTPRKRKSVRVSLKPTFSPSPPAIEYSEEGNSDRRPSSRHHSPKSLHPYAPVRRVPISSHGEGDQTDNWADSSDEDEEYKNAKAALSKAAKKDKEVSQSVFGH